MSTVMIFGSFDILHSGHFHVFKNAKQHGDKLVAVVARDKNMREYKNVEPFHTEEERRAMLENIQTIDEVVLGHPDDFYKVVKDKSPDVIALGYDQRLFVDKLESKLLEFGLNSKIVRLPSYKPEKYKSGKIKDYLMKHS